LTFSAPKNKIPTDNIQILPTPTQERVDEKNQLNIAWQD